MVDRRKKPAQAKRRKGTAAGGPNKQKGLPPRTLYSPAEVVARSGISRQLLHNYTVLGLLKPAERTPTGRRYYDESVFRRISLIRRMLAQGYTLQALRELFPWEK